MPSILLDHRIRKIDPNPVPDSRKAMIVKTLQGIPFLCDQTTKVLYAYEKVPTQPLVALGTYDPVTEKFTLYQNWKELYQPKLEAHRAIEKPRSRLPQATK